MAWFQVCYVKQQWWVVQGDGGTSFEVVAVAGIVFKNVSGGRGFGAKNPKLSTWARFQAVSVQMLLKWVAVSIQQPIVQ